MPGRRLSRTTAFVSNLFNHLGLTEIIWHPDMNVGKSRKIRQCLWGFGGNPKPPAHSALFAGAKGLTPAPGLSGKV